MKATLLVLGLGMVTAGICAAEAEGSFDRSLSVSGAVDLDVVTDSGGITVTPGASGSVRIHAILKAQHGWFDSGDIEQRIREIERNPPIEQNGSQIRIGYVHRHDLLKNISMRSEIQTPRDTKVRARADSGGIHLSQSRAAPIRAKADSGGVTVRLASNAGYDINVESESGHISVPEVSVHGDLSKHHVEGKVRGGGPTVEVRVDSGNVSIE
jgi:hypothetical protein